MSGPRYGPGGDAAARRMRRAVRLLGEKAPSRLPSCLYAKSRPHGPLPAVAQAVPLVPVLLGAAVGWWCARRAAETEASGTGSVASLVLDAVIAAALAAVLLSVLLLLSAGSAGPDRLADVGPSAWLAGLALLGELTAGAAVAAWITGRR